MREYDSNFYSYLATFAVRSAQQVVPLLISQLQIGSVADFGCGHGAWLSVWRKAGASVTGVDGAYVDLRELMISAAEFRTADLSQPLDLARRFDLVQSLEVAEHLPPDRADVFIDILTAHGPLVMFSAAVPGQGGEHHINEEPLEYWQKKFRNRGYAAIDYIRPTIANNKLVQRWYRCNIILYVREDYLDSSPQSLRVHHVPADQELREYWPLSYRFRHALVRQLPPRTVNTLSRLRTRALKAARHARSSP